MMLTIRDMRMTGCPQLVEVATPEGAWAIANALGIPRESALVLPVVEHPSHRTTRTAIDAVERRAAAPRDDGSVRAELRIEPWTVEAMQGHCALRDDGVVLGLDEREWRVLRLAPDKVLLSIDEDTVGEAAVEDLSPRLDGTSRWWGAVKQPKKSGAKTTRAKKGGAK